MFQPQTVLTEMFNRQAACFNLKQYWLTCSTDKLHVSTSNSTDMLDG